MPPVGKDSITREKPSWLKVFKPRQKWSNKVKEWGISSEEGVKTCAVMKGLKCKQ